MPANVAPNCPNTLECVRVWLCRLSFDPLPREPAKKEGDETAKESDKKNIFAKYMGGLHIQPLKQAHVLVIPTAGEGQSVPAAPDNAILCRTNDEGELLTITEGQIGSNVPASNPSTWVRFVPDTTVVYYWTLCPKRFRRVLKDIRKNYASAALLHDFSSFQVSPQFTSTNFSPANRKFLFELLEDTDDWWPADAIFEHALLSPPSANAGPGFFQGFALRFSHPGTKELKTYLPYVLARRRVADAVYCGELAQYHALGLRQRSAEDFALFAQVKDMKKKAQTEMSSEFVSTTQYEYYTYGRQCGLDSNVDRGLYSHAVDVSPGRNDWKKAQAKIASDYHYASPSMLRDVDDPRYVHMETIDHADAMRYFDFHRFSINPEVQPTLQYAEESLPKIANQLNHLSSRVRAFIGAIPYYDVILSLGAYPNDSTLDKMIHGRYLDLSLDIGHPWWTTFEPEDDSAWEQLKPYVEDIGSFADKSFGTYSEHFNDLEHIEKYNKALKNSTKQAKILANRMVTWNDLIGGKKTALTDPFDKTFQVDADFKNGVITIRKGGKKIGQLELLLQEVKHDTVTIAQEVKEGGRRVGWRRVSVPEDFPRFELRPKFKEVKAWPNWFGVFGQVLSLTVSLSEAAAEWNKQGDSSSGKIILAAKVAKDTLQLVDGFSAALHATFPYAQDAGVVVRFAKVGEVVKGPGLVLEAILNLQEGAVILTLGEDSSAASAVRRGDFYEGALEEARGLVLVASPALGAAEGIGALWAGETAAAAFVGALPMLGLGLAIAGLAIVAINIVLYVHYGPTDSMKGFAKALDKARVKEFGDSLNVPERHRTEDSLRRFALTVEKLVAANPIQSAWQK